MGWKLSILERSIYYLDIDDLANSDFLKELGFRYQPQFVLLDGEGNILKQWLGPVTAKDFRDVFDLYVHQTGS